MLDSLIIFIDSHSKLRRRMLKCLLLITYYIMME